LGWEIFEEGAVRYEAWYETQRGRDVDRSECALLANLLRRFPPPRRLLEVGCGTGHFTHWLADNGFGTIGLDRSPAMVREARRRRPPGPLVLGDAHRLPFQDRGVDLAILVTTLEFLESPRIALRECARIAERGLVLLVLNRWSLGALSRRWGSQSRGALLARAHDFSLPTLRGLLVEAAGDRLRGLHWRSVLFPRPFDGRVTPLPFGDVLGVAVDLVPESAA
jgi:SAM-dependent methyltransferase